MTSLETFIEHFEDAVEDVAPGTLSADTKYLELEVWDSLAVLTVIAMLNAEYGVSITASQLKTLTTLSALYEFVSAEEAS